MSKSKLNEKAGNTAANKQKIESRYQADTFFTVLSYCLLIIFLPVVGFFSTKYFLFDGLLDLPTIQSNIYSAVTAVVLLHLALFLYIYRAYFESDDPIQAKKKD